MKPALCQTVSILCLAPAPVPGAMPGHELPPTALQPPSPAAQAAEMLERQFGLRLRRLGDAVAAIFGPAPGDDDPVVRSVRAALEIQMRLGKANPSAAPRIGIHAGPATASGEARAEDLELGRHLAALAPAGGVLLSQETYRQVYGLIDAQVMAPLTPERGGATGPTYLALRVRPAILARTLRGVELAEAPMVGRSAELEALQTAFRGAAENRECRIVTVSGEAGIGKSRLLREFQRWLQTIPQYRAILFSGRAEPETMGEPFSLIRDVFRSRFEILDSDPVSVAQEKIETGLAGLLGSSASRLTAGKIGPLLGMGSPTGAPELGSPEEAQTARHQIFENLGELLASVAPARNGVGAAHDAPPTAVLLTVDDLHCSDDDSLDLLAHVARSSRRAPLMILALARPALLDRRPGWAEGLPGHTLLELKPLSPRESEILIETIMSQASQVPAAIRETILADAGGHPYYIEEIIQVLTEKNVIFQEGDRWRFDARRLARVPVSATLRGLLRARLESLPALERGLLQSASVVGHVFWDSALESLSSAPVEASNDRAASAKRAIPEALASLCRKELIHRREASGFAGTVEYDFKHELLREVAFESVPRKNRLDYHAAVAEWFAGHSGDRTREFAGLVAVHFEQAGKVAEAAEWYGRAAEQAWTSFAPAAAIDHYQKAMHLFRSAPENRGRGERLAWQEGLGNALTMAGRFNEALNSFAQVRALAEAAGDSAAGMRAWNGTAYLHERCGNYRASVEAAEQAQAQARQAGVTGSDELIRATYLKGWALYRLGDAPAVLTLAAQTLALCENTGKRSWMAHAFKLYGVANLQLGRSAEADGYFEKGLALCLECGDRHGTNAMFSNLGESARLRGDYPRAIDLYRQALAGAREIGDRPGEMVYLSNLAGARLGLSQFAEAEAELRQAIAMTGMPKSCTLTETYSFLAQACLGQRKLTEALEAARRAVAIGQATENHFELAGSWRTLGQVLAAAAPLGESGPATAPPSSPSADDVDSCFAESARLYETIGAAAEKARTLRLWAELSQSAAKPGEGARQRGGIIESGRPTGAP